MKKVLQVLIIIVCCGLSSCSSVEKQKRLDMYRQSIEQSEKRAEETQLAHENVFKQARSEDVNILIDSFYTSHPNSAGGVDVNISIKNLSGKTIKYITFITYAYNAVGDIQEDSVTGSTVGKLNFTGPLLSNASDDVWWENVWWNHSIKSFRITEIEIKFMDGFTMKVEKNKLPKYYYNYYKTD